MNKIPFMDLSRQYQSIKAEILPALEMVCEKTAFSSGPFVDQFEGEFASYCNADYCAGVNSGTSALHLALLALGIGSCDEVIVPANTFVATAWSVSYTGATPVFCDCDGETWNIDSQSAESKITSRTKAIIGVHLYGQPFNVDAISRLCKKNYLFMLEDCAQSQGAEFNGERVGVFGEMGCFSFYPGKNLGAYGEAGAVISMKKEYIDHIKRLRNHASAVRYYHDELGFNMRMDGFQGAVLSVKLKYLSAWNQRRREIAKKYQLGITNPAVKMQKQPEWARSVYHLFVVIVDNRERFMNYLEEKGIQCGLHYPVPCHLQKAYSGLGYQPGSLPNAEYLANHCVSLPMFPELRDAEIESVVAHINSFQG